MVLERLNNIYVIDTNMYGFSNYTAAYLVQGKEIALIDTGLPTQFDAVLAGIKAHGFSISDISYIFITHCEHIDHSGNIAPILRESPKANVYINPVGLEFLTNPAKEREYKKNLVSPVIYNKGGEMDPVPPSRIKYLKDGDIFDLGNGEKLKVISLPTTDRAEQAYLRRKTMASLLEI